LSPRIAGLFGGIVNAAAGGAKLFVFPMLLAAGLPPLVANATGTAGVWPSQLAAIWVFREHLRDKIRDLIRQMLPALAGANSCAMPPHARTRRRPPQP